MCVIWQKGHILRFAKPEIRSHAPVIAPPRIPNSPFQKVRPHRPLLPKGISPYVLSRPLSKVYWSTSCFPLLKAPNCCFLRKQPPPLYSYHPGFSQLFSSRSRFQQNFSFPWQPTNQFRILNGSNLIVSATLRAHPSSRSASAAAVFSSGSSLVFIIPGWYKEPPLFTFNYVLDRPEPLGFLGETLSSLSLLSRKRPACQKTGPPPVTRGS